MTILSTLLRATALGVFFTILSTQGALAGDIEIVRPYARTSGANAKSGAMFLLIVNHGASADRLLSVRTDVAKKAMLHTNIEDENGVMKMRPLPDGIEIPAGAEHRLKRGGDHVMLMGIGDPLADGDRLSVTLVFENAGEIAISVPVDQARKPASD